ncbi:MAG: hypothetical protein KL863_23720 [Rhizobium sp.]|nr:hypothetical protein [Rhizobium sp.]
MPEKKAAWLGSRPIEMDFRPGGAERIGFSNEMGDHLNQTRYFRDSATRS